VELFLFQISNILAADLLLTYRTTASSDTLAALPSP